MRKPFRIGFPTREIGLSPNSIRIHSGAKYAFGHEYAPDLRPKLIFTFTPGCQPERQSPENRKSASIPHRAPRAPRILRSKFRLNKKSKWVPPYAYCGRRPMLTISHVPAVAVCHHANSTSATHPFLRAPPLVTISKFRIFIN